MRSREKDGDEQANESERGTKEAIKYILDCGRSRRQPNLAFWPLQKPIAAGTLS